MAAATMGTKHGTTAKAGSDEKAAKKADLMEAKTAILLKGAAAAKAEATAKEIPGYPGKMDPLKVEKSDVNRKEYADDWNREWKLGAPRKLPTEELEVSEPTIEPRSAAVASRQPHIG